MIPEYAERVSSDLEVTNVAFFRFSENETNMENHMNGLLQLKAIVGVAHPRHMTSVKYSLRR